MSQIAVVAVMCKPHRCPHINMTGNICVYCPGGPDSDFEYSTQSYTGYEPTSMRAIRARYDPFLQTRHRVEQVCSFENFFYLCLITISIKLIIFYHIFAVKTIRSQCR